MKNNKIRCIAVDDEPLALNIVKMFCNKSEGLDLQETFTNGLEALKYLKNNDIDLIFLDINMDHISGVELAKLLDDDVLIIFTTAYQNYAIEGFELKALDYLLKPFSFDRFTTAIERAKKQYQLIKGNSDSPAESSDTDSSPFMMIRSDYATVRVDISSIICVEGLKDYVKIYTDERNYVTKITMKSIEQHLEPYGFMRIHKSYVVNLSKIILYENNQIILPKNISVSVGNIYKSNFVDYIQKNKV